jgi:3-hydroxyisobutyrate dehydrogenase-like beta-hydroxyacid dehydrogenase
MTGEETGGKSEDPPRVGFIGLGSQGGPMARRIVEDGFPLTLWARRPQSLEPFQDASVAVASTPGALGAQSEVVGICVVGDDDVEDVLLRADGVLSGMSPGGIVAIHSTVHPDTCRRVATQAAEYGVAVIDAPVSGGGNAAANRSLLVMVGGEPAAVERCRPVLETFGSPVAHLGPLGSGQIAKLINNLVFTAHVSMALDTFSFAEQLGIDQVSLGNVLTHGSGGSRAVDILLASGIDLAGLRSAFSLLKKDVGLVLDVARQNGSIEPPMLVDAALRTLDLLEN